LTALELASRRANLAKARAVANRSYRRTEKRLDASRANIQKAIAARRGPQGNASARLNALKHGLFAQHALAESVDRLGEDKQEFDLHLRLFERVFVPADEEERQIVRGLAQTVWRRLRFFHAKACWEKEKLHSMFAQAPGPAKLSLDDTVARAYGLAQALMQFEVFFRELSKLESQVESRLRKLIRKRSQGKLRWKAFSPRRDPAWECFIEGEKLSQLAEQWDAMSPEEQATLCDQVRQEADAKRDGLEREDLPRDCES
jgi:hypothetical protein